MLTSCALRPGSDLPPALVAVAADAISGISLRDEIQIQHSHAEEKSVPAER